VAGTEIFQLLAARWPTRRSARLKRASDDMGTELAALAHARAGMGIQPDAGFQGTGGALSGALSSLSSATDSHRMLYRNLTVGGFSKPRAHCRSVAPVIAPMRRERSMHRRRFKTRDCFHGFAYGPEKSARALGEIRFSSVKHRPQEGGSEQYSGRPSTMTRLKCE
jgi:hypothetical protein